MNTLELMIKEIYDENKYLYNDNLIHSIAEYIEHYNKCKDVDDPVYTPRQWYYDTKLNTPEEFITREGLLGKICDHFLKQRVECIDQTGCLPCYVDFKEDMESDDFKNEFGMYPEADTITMVDVINFLLDYYENN